MGRGKSRQAEAEGGGKGEPGTAIPERLRQVGEKTESMSRPNE